MPPGIYEHKKLPLDVRFMLQVLPEPNSGCWLWSGTTNFGYGIFWLQGKRFCRAHKFAYELFKGPVPAGLELDHLCRTRCCVNPDHLEPVTTRENTLRGNSFAGVNARKTHCPQGHPYSEENTYKNPAYPNGRYCRQCERNRQADRRAVRKVAK